MPRSSKNRESSFLATQQGKNGPQPLKNPRKCRKNVNLPCPLTEQYQNEFLGMQKWGKWLQTWRVNTQEASTAWRKPTCRRMVRETGKHGCMAKWACILGVYFPQKSKLIFPKNGFSPNLNFIPIHFPSPCNNYFNQFLAELNDWVNETRKVVDYVIYSPFGPKG